MFGGLATTSNMLRDTGEEPVEAHTRRPLRMPFSLGRTQMAFWFFIDLASYLLIFAVTRERDTIPPEVLALLGISASTALGAVLIDSSKDAAAKAELEATDVNWTPFPRR
jgi:hypothetical protein